MTKRALVDRFSGSRPRSRAPVLDRRVEAATTGRARRRLAAWLCLWALAAGAVALPALHAALHLAEHFATAPEPAPRPRVVVHRYQHCHGGTCHDVDEGRRHAPREPHRHDGDRPGEHGRASPEHLAVLALRAPAPTVPPRVVPAIIVGRVVVLQPIVATAVRAHDIRGPPRAQT